MSQIGTKTRPRNGKQNRPARTSSLGGMVGPAHPPEMGPAPDGGAWVTKLGPWSEAWPSGFCVCLGRRNFALFGGLAAKIRVVSLG